MRVIDSSTGGEIIPDELSEIITPPAPDEVPGDIIKNRNLETPRKSPEYPGLSSAGISTDLYRETRKWLNDWLSENIAQTGDYSEWWEEEALPAKDRLNSWKSENASRNGQVKTPEEDDNGKGIRPPQDTVPANRDSHLPPNAPRGAMPPQRPAKYPPYNYSESAWQAACWMAERWPKEVQEQGYDAWITARHDEIVSLEFPARYWKQAQRRDPSACVSAAYNSPAADDEGRPWFDPDAQRSITTWSQASAPYPLPPAFTGGSQPSPGWAGTTINKFLSDQYHAAHIETHDLDEPYDTVRMPPLFMAARTRHIVQADGAPAKVQYSAYLLPFLCNESGSADSDTVSLPLHGRLYKWTHSQAPGGSPTYHGVMDRHFGVDLRIMCMMAPDENLECNRVRIKMGSGAGMGRYYGTSRNITSNYVVLEAVVYQPKTEDDQGDPSDHDVMIYGCEAQLGCIAVAVSEVPMLSRTYDIFFAVDSWLAVEALQPIIGGFSRANFVAYSGGVYTFYTAPRCDIPEIREIKRFLARTIEPVPPMVHVAYEPYAESLLGQRAWFSGATGIFMTKTGRIYSRPMGANGPF